MGQATSGGAGKIHFGRGEDVIFWPANLYLHLYLLNLYYWSFLLTNHASTLINALLQLKLLYVICSVAIHNLLLAVSNSRKLQELGQQIKSFLFWFTIRWFGH